jgi:hypothetical protein
VRYGTGFAETVGLFDLDSEALVDAVDELFGKGCCTRSYYFEGAEVVVGDYGGFCEMSGIVNLRLA